MHAGGMAGGSSADPTRTDIENWFEGPDRENDCRNKILALKREANEYGRVVESHTVTRRGETTILKAVLRDAPKHRPGRKFRRR
jgi:hypothetical protein